MTVTCGMEFETHSNVWVFENIGCTAPGLYPTNNIALQKIIPVPSYGRDAMNSGPLEKGKFYCSRQIPLALNSRNPFPRLFLGRGKPPSGKT